MAKRLGKTGGQEPGAERDPLNDAFNELYHIPAELQVSLGHSCWPQNLKACRLESASCMWHDQLRHGWLADFAGAEWK